MSVILLGLLLVCTSACGSTTQLTRGDLRVFTFTHDATNVFLLARGDGLVMVDSGYAANAPALERDIRAAGFDPARIAAVVLTHGHADHAGGAQYFQRRFHIPVFAGEGDVAMLRAGKNEKLCPTGLLGRVRLRKESGRVYPSTVPDDVVRAPRALPGFPDGRIVPLPGHTRGSLVVVVGEVAFAGDLFRGALVGDDAADHLYMCDLADNQRDGAELVRSIAPDAKLFFVGHFGPVERADVADYFHVPSAP